MNWHLNEIGGEDMMKVIFMKPDGDELLTKDLKIEQIQALKIVDLISFPSDDNTYRLNEMEYSVDYEYLRVWLDEA